MIEPVVHWYFGPLTRLMYLPSPDELVFAPMSAPIFYWSAPVELMGPGGRLLDLRDMGSQAETTEAGGRHFGIVISSVLLPITPTGWEHLGSGPAHEIQTDGTTRRKLANASGNRSLSSGNLRDTLAEIFIYNSDSEGQVSPRPLMPTPDGRFRLNKFIDTGVLINWNRPQFAHYVDHLRKQYKERRQQDADPIKYRMWMASTLDRHRIDRRNYRHFQDEESLDEPPIDPSTPITESFPGTSATFGGDLTWYEFDVNFQNVTGQAFKSGTVFGLARCESVLSSGDMYAETARNSGNSYGWLGCAVRLDSIFETGYWSALRFADTSSWCATIYKRVSGSDTQLSFLLGSTHRSSVPFDERLEVNGSDLELFETGVSVITLTDTSITSANVRAGVSGRDSGANCYATDWEADSLAIPAATGEITSNLFLPTQSGQGKVLVSGNGSQNLFLPVSSSQGSVSVRGDIAQNLYLPISTSQGSVPVQGGIVSNLFLPSQSLVGKAPINGDISQEMYLPISTVMSETYIKKCQQRCGLGLYTHLG